jgi:hypothetical protein
LRFFFDNNLAPKLARGLNVFVSPTHSVLHLRDKFPGNAEDAEWMRELAREADWIIVTADVRIGQNPHEIEAWKEAGHTIFFLKPGWTDMTFWVQANKFTKCFPEMIAVAEKAKRGSFFTVSVNGKIQALQ